RGVTSSKDPPDQNRPTYDDPGLPVEEQSPAGEGLWRGPRCSREWMGRDSKAPAGDTPANTAATAMNAGMLVWYGMASMAYLWLRGHGLPRRKSDDDDTLCQLTQLTPLIFWKTLGYPTYKAWTAADPMFASPFLNASSTLLHNASSTLHQRIGQKFAGTSSSSDSSLSRLRRCFGGKR
ncbi:hypothetical protein THAOC_35868, partial [Thalassiosira oceanica]